MPLEGGGWHGRVARVPAHVGGAAVASCRSLVDRRRRRVVCLAATTSESTSSATTPALLLTTVAEVRGAPTGVSGSFSCSCTQALDFCVCHLLIYGDEGGDGRARQIRRSAFQCVVHK